MRSKHLIWFLLCPGEFLGHDLLTHPAAAITMMNSICQGFIVCPALAYVLPVEPLSESSQQLCYLHFIDVETKAHFHPGPGAHGDAVGSGSVRLVRESVLLAVTLS